MAANTPLMKAGESSVLKSEAISTASETATAAGVSVRYRISKQASLKIARSTAGIRSIGQFWLSELIL